MPKALVLNLTPIQISFSQLILERLKTISTKGYQKLLASENAYELFFQAIATNKLDFVRLFISEKIDLMESAKMAERIIKLFQGSKSVVFPDKDWANMKISEIMYNILEAKKLMLSDRGSYSFISDPLVRRRIQPIQVLFLWALLCERLELAEIFWQSSGIEFYYTVLQFLKSKSVFLCSPIRKI